MTLQQADDLLQTIGLGQQEVKCRESAMFVVLFDLDAEFTAADTNVTQNQITPH